MSENHLSIDPSLAPPEEADAQTENLVGQVAAQIEQETIQRATDQGAARLSLAAKLDLSAPGCGSAETQGLVERLAQRTEQEAVARGADEWDAFHPNIDVPDQDYRPDDDP
ncbi:MAG: hypothetical protein KKA73_30960 [Chloroflexi bacterium]|nr:hypothetical protein [Chloroflexota bacterium]MBU1752123.1 hypothetical protein [Chloroflexota bacterium]